MSDYDNFKRTADYKQIISDVQNRIKTETKPLKAQLDEAVRKLQSLQARIEYLESRIQKS